MTSSVPRREYALDNVSISFEPGFHILKGASSSGKSTVLRLILGSEEPVKGSVATVSSHQDVPPALPILLEQKPVFDSSRTVQQSLCDAMSAIANSKQDETLANVLDLLQLAAKVNLKPSELSPSESYQFRLAEASIQSMVGSACLDQSAECSIPAPVILLDEWLDKETSVVIRKVQDTMERLADRGAVVICVTHKPDLFSSTNLAEPITLCRGSILRL